MISCPILIAFLGEDYTCNTQLSTNFLNWNIIYKSHWISILLHSIKICLNLLNQFYIIYLYYLTRHVSNTTF